MIDVAYVVGAGAALVAGWLGAYYAVAAVRRAARRR